MVVITTDFKNNLKYSVEDIKRVLGLHCYRARTKAIEMFRDIYTEHNGKLRSYLIKMDGADRFQLDKAGQPIFQRCNIGFSS